MAKYIIGVDLGGTNTKIGLVKGKNIVSCRILNTKDYPSKDKLINTIIANIEDILKEHSLRRRDVLGIGMGVPGPVNYKQGRVHYFPNIAGWRSVALKKIMQAKIKIPVFIDNDVNALALAELNFGSGKNIKNFIVLTLGTGVGGGVVVGGRLYRGSNSCAGEVGHIPINEYGPKCNCGGRACLERYIGNKYILQEAKHIINKPDITLEYLSQLAKIGNKKAIQIWQVVGRRLGVALTGLVNFFNPQRIIIGGGVAQAGSILFDEVRKTVRTRAMHISRQAVRVIKAKSGKNAGVIGAACLVREGLFLKD